MKYLRIHNLIAVLFALWLGFARSSIAVELTRNEMQEVLKISKNIGLAKPPLPDSKKLEYALGIFKASKNFGILPNLLIAIAAQETSFREDLPEGKAGEFGIVQIRKIWAKNPKLRKHFKNISIKDLKTPEKAFSYAAWILHDLKKNAPKSAIPFWSFYNARGFEPRFKYFLSVNQKLSYLNRGIPFSREIEENIQINGSADQKSWQPDVRILATATKDISSAKEVSKIIEKPSELVTTAGIASEVQFKPQDWVAKAINRLRDEPVKAPHANITVPISQLKTTNTKAQQRERLALTKTAKILLNSIQD